MSIRILALLLCLLIGCAPKEVLIIETEPEPPPPPPFPELPGVDSIFVAVANVYESRGGLVDDQSVAEAQRATEGGRRLLEIADSLTKELVVETDSVVVDELEGIRRYNAGAQMLQGNELGLEEYRGAAEQFRQALEFNPYDSEAMYYLSRVYELMYQRLGQQNAREEQINVLLDLAKLHPERYDYAALLASAKESLGTSADWLDAAGWWYRAVALLKDNTLMSLETGAVLDSATVFFYLTSASRAFVEADRGDEALAALDEAEEYVLNDDSRGYVEAEREWLLWDNVVQTRKQFDTLMQTSVDDPTATIAGLRDLLPDVTNPIARLEVQYQLALALYNSGQQEAGVDSIQSVWKEVFAGDVPFRARVQESYGVMTYSLGLVMRDQGKLRNALAYLLQSESTAFSQAALAALTLSVLLRNDAEASLEAAERAEAGWDKLTVQDQHTLLQHMVDLHRRLQNRESAISYSQRYREFVSGDQIN